jgi:UDP-N-acetylmuramate--alanine ligase
MRDLTTINSIYFIGIGGIGMSALARYFKAQGKAVSGYDKTETELTKQLVQEGIAVHYTEDLDQAPKNADLVVYTPAVPADHKELVFYRDNSYYLLKRSEVLGLITNSSFNICVAGTHGKTTISTMIAHILRHSGYGCNAFLGGVSVNYDTNFWSSPNNVCVVEADEYDRSFLRLSPDIAVITAMDADHLDIYGTEEAMEDAFIEFSGKVKKDGLLLSKFGLKRGSELNAADHQTYSLQNDSADIYGANVRITQGSYEFDVMMKDFMLDNVRLNMGGMHNVENSIAAIAVARRLNIRAEKIKAAVEDFRGVKRRFEYIIRNKNMVFIDDYAHHPEELRALITGAKALFSGTRCTVVFQPHLYTRTRDLATEFAKVLDLAHEVILLPIYPARELPIAGVSSNMILDRMYSDDKHLMTKEELLNWMNTHEVELFITAGAGDIDTLVQPLKEILTGSA